MNKISLFCALALIGSTAFALDKAGCEFKRCENFKQRDDRCGVRAAPARNF